MSVGTISRRWPTVAVLTGLVVTTLPAATTPTDPPRKNTPSAHATPGVRKVGPDKSIDWVSVQAALDRAGFSPGEIDGRDGNNTRQALAAYAESHEDDGSPSDPALALDALSSQSDPALVDYQVTEADVAGPFAPEIPEELPEQASLEALAYRTPLEALAERFHASPALLQKINPGLDLTAGATIRVPNVPRLELPGYSGARKPDDAPKRLAARIVVDNETSALTAYDEAGTPIFHAPVTTGSEHDPLPVGQWKVTGVFLMPRFYYNPDLFWDADPSHSKTVIAPGPNNPVGVAWIGIDKEHYGLHGTPEPSRIAYRASHGCVRLTNWDVLRVAALVQKGTPVIFQ